MGNPTNADWLRLAAFIDSEGCIHIAKSRPHSQVGEVNFRHQLILLIANCDLRMPIWCRDTFGVGTVSVKRPATHKWRTSFTWHVYAKQAEDILRGCLPFFLLKKEQAEVALLLRATFRKRKQPLEPEILEYRDGLREQLKALHHKEVLNVLPF